MPSSPVCHEVVGQKEKTKGTPKSSCCGTQARLHIESSSAGCCISTSSSQHGWQQLNKGTYSYIARLRLWLFSALTAVESRDRPLPSACTRQPRRLLQEVKRSTVLSACCGVVRVQPMQNVKPTESLVGSTSRVAKKVLLLPSITFEPGCRIE
jgi:hypothetical protein